MIRKGTHKGEKALKREIPEKIPDSSKNESKCVLNHVQQKNVLLCTTKRICAEFKH